MKKFLTYKKNFENITKALIGVNHFVAECFHVEISGISIGRGVYKHGERPFTTAYISCYGEFYEIEGWEYVPPTPLSNII